MPFVSINGLGLSVANDLIEKRNIKIYTSKEDLRIRSKLNKTILSNLEKFGVLEHLPDQDSGFIDSIFG